MDDYKDDKEFKGLINDLLKNPKIKNNKYTFYYIFYYIINLKHTFVATRKC